MARATEKWLRHPALDCLLPLTIVSCWFFLVGGHFPDRTSVDLMLTALASAGGLVMAVATLAIGMMHQSADDRVVRMRTLYMNQLRRNWTWIFFSLLFATLFPIVGLALGENFLQWGFAIALTSACLVVANLLRVVYLLRLVLLLEANNNEEHVRGDAPDELFDNPYSPSIS